MTDLKTHLKRQLTYDRWANMRTLSSLNANTEAYDSSEIRSWFSHLLAAQSIWLARIRGEDTSEVVFWPEIPHDDWPDRVSVNYEALVAVLGYQNMDPEAVITYQNSKGHTFETPLRDILQHLVIHGQHHRAQIMSALRRLGGTPLPSDYISFCRDQRN